MPAYDPGCGNPGGGIEGPRRSFNRAVLLAFAEDFGKHGKEVIEKTRKEHPAAYLKLACLLIPRDMRIEHLSLPKTPSAGVTAATESEHDCG
jgi:hypothetical protein